MPKGEAVNGYRIYPCNVWHILEKYMLETQEEESEDSKVSGKLEG